MAYFSLFYENEEQEASAKGQAQNQVYYPARQKTEKKVVFVGSKMVISEETSNAPNELPCFFQDLNLDSVFLPRYDGSLPEFLKVLLFSFPADNSTIIYRQDIYKDLENPAVFQGLTDFRNYFTEAARLSASSLQSDNLLQQSKYQLDGGVKYYQAVSRLHGVLTGNAVSAAFTSLVSILETYLNREDLTDFYRQACLLKQQLESIDFTLSMTGNTVKVTFSRDTTDFGRDVQKVFRYDENAGDSLRLFNQPGLNPFETKLLSLVEKEYPKLCKECVEFTSSHSWPEEKIITRLYSEAEFYLSNHLLADDLNTRGFTLNYPEYPEQGGFHLTGICNIHLALASARAKNLVLNNLVLQKDERGAWITGVNQGGKTTYARSVGQSVYLAMLGMPIIAGKTRLPHLNGIYTHFTVAENHLVNNGKLLEELKQLKEVLQKSPANCLFILNEMFSSTTAADAYDLTDILLPQLHQKAGTVLCVTHVPELARLKNDMISLVASAGEDESHERNYRICPGEAVLRARAMDIALKYHLSGAQIKERMSNGN